MKQDGKCCCPTIWQQQSQSCCQHGNQLTPSPVCWGYSMKLEGNHAIDSAWWYLQHTTQHTIGSEPVQALRTSCQRKGFFACLGNSRHKRTTDWALFDKWAFSVGVVCFFST